MTTAETAQTAARFTLDEGKAREWLPELHPDRYQERPEHDDRPEIDDDYDPRTDYESGSTAFNLVASARDAGIITGPGTIDYEHESDGYGEVGYTWLLRVRAGDIDAGTWSELKLSSIYEDLRHCGDPDVTGADAALALLREGTETANSLLDDLGRYVAALPLALRAPEVADLLGKVRALAPEWEAGNLIDAAGAVCDAMRELEHRLSTA